MYNVRLFRCFFGGYAPDEFKLTARGYHRIRMLPCFLTSINANQGSGQIKGITQKKGVIYPGVEVSVFKRSDKTHLWTVRSKQDGSYAFRNIAAGLECFVVGFDPEQNYNAVISDKVVAK